MSENDAELVEAWRTNAMDCARENERLDHENDRLRAAFEKARVVIDEHPYYNGVPTDEWEAARDAVLLPDPGDSR